MGKYSSFPGLRISLTIFSLCSSSWQMRRVLWTKDIMFIGRINEHVVVDSIPLYEVKSIEVVRSQDYVTDLQLEVSDEDPDLQIEKNMKSYVSEGKSISKKLSLTASSQAAER